MKKRETVNGFGKVKIGGIDFDVVPLIDEFSNYSGMYVEEDCKIYVRECNPQQMYKIFLHELTHGIFNSILGRERESSDEELVDGIAGALMMLIRDNPGIFDINLFHKS